MLYFINILLSYTIYTIFAYHIKLYIMFRIKEILSNTVTDDGKKATIVWLSNKIKMAQPNVNNIVNSKAKPTIDTLQSIATALNVEVWELFERKSTTEITALIEFNNEFYKAETLEELKEVIKKIEEK